MAWRVAPAVYPILAIGKISVIGARFAVTTGIIAYDLIFLTEELKLLIPHATIGNTSMDKQYWRTRSSDFIIESTVIYGGIT